MDEAFIVILGACLIGLLLGGICWLTERYGPFHHHSSDNKELVSTQLKSDLFSGDKRNSRQ